MEQKIRSFSFIIKSFLFLFHFGIQRDAYSFFQLKEKNKFKNLSFFDHQFSIPFKYSIQSIFSSYKINRFQNRYLYEL